MKKKPKKMKMQAVVTLHIDRWMLVHIMIVLPITSLQSYKYFLTICSHTLLDPKFS